jgi:ATP-binding cassette subfamily B protein
VFVIVGKLRRDKLRPIARDAKAVESSTVSIVHEVLGALRVVKAFGQEQRERSRYLDRSEEAAQKRMRHRLLEDRFGFVVGVTTALGTALVIVFGVSHVQTGALTLGELLLVMAYLGRIYEPLQEMGAKTAGLQSALASAERAFALLDEAPDVSEIAGALPIQRARGGVEFRDVSFSFQSDRTVLRNVSFRVGPGSRVGIAGRTGSGKTTLMHLMTRFFDPTSGSILLDGVDLREYRLADLRNQFAFVLQEPILFSTTIAENIAYSRPGASRDEIARAAEMANAHEFITRLPAGYATLVGERGMQLSGGERQRISLARAFLKDAPILVLDEPTSSVDVHTEAVIIDAMQRLMRGRTTFIVAHRLVTLDGCDVRLGLSEGEMEVIVDSVGSDDWPTKRPAEATA